MSKLDRQKLLNQIRRELKQNVDPVYRDGARRYFKEKIRNYGVRTPVVRKIANKYYQSVKSITKEELFELAEILLKSSLTEEATIAFSWVYKTKNKFEKQDFKTFEAWVKKYVDNWAKCDDFCTHSVGYLVYSYPELADRLFNWTRSKNRWLKRAAAVTLIYPVVKGKLLKQVFKTAEKLLMDEDDLVQKGYGWMLKVASEVYQKKVFEFVIKHKNRMPRTALRYAIEKMPLSLKTRAMKK